MGRKIEVSPSFCAMICLIGWVDIQIAKCFLLAVAVHELAHCIVALLCRVRVEQVSFRIFGAVIQTQSMNYGQEILIAMAGPVASLLMAYAFRGMDAVFFIINALLAGVNLLPIYPMDGGRMFQSVLMLNMSPSSVHKIMCVIAFFVCSALMVAACWFSAAFQAGIWPIFAALVVLSRVWESSCAEVGV